MNTYIRKLWIKLIKITENKFYIYINMFNIYMLQNISVSNKCCSFERSIHQTIQKKISV